MQNHVPMWVGPPNVDSHRRGLRSSAPGPGLTSTWPVSHLLGEQLASAAGGSDQAGCHLSAVVRGTGPRPACADSLNTRCSGAGDSCQRGGCPVPAHLVLDGSWGAWSGESRLSYQPSPGVQGPHAGSRRSHKEACSLHSGPTRSRRGLGSPPSPCPEGPSLRLTHSCQAAASSLSCPGPGEGGCHHPCFPNGTTPVSKEPSCTPACPCCAHSPSPGPSAFGLVLARHTRLSRAGRGQTVSTSPGPQGHHIQSPLPGNPASFSHSPLRGGLCTGPVSVWQCPVLPSTWPLFCAPRPAPCWASPEGSGQTSQASRPMALPARRPSSPCTLLCPGTLAGTRGTVVPPDRPPPTTAPRGP